jgi:CDP-glycerol glycerophosphotransferase (TagB/SpsB family)
VKRGTLAYFRSLRVAEYVITNSAFPLEYIKPRGQVYVNTWHGNPLKRMGYDLPRGAFGARNVVRNLLSADFLLSAGPSMTQCLYRDAFRLDGLYQGVVIETGQPRMADQAAADAQAVRRRLQQRGLAVGDSTGVVLYAPTWRGESTRRPEADLEALRAVVATLREAVGAGVDVLLKVHQLVYRWGADDPELADVLVPNDVNTNELLAAVDVLVTDYSSIFFDFLAEDRPIVFYVPDRAQYEDGRGLYYPIDSLPGELSDDPESLADAVRRAVRDGEGEEVVRRRADWTATHAPFADASITGRVIDAVFRKQTAGVGLVSLLSPERARILVRVGRVNDADVLREVLDAVEDADPVRNDVTVSFSNSTTQSNAEMVRTLEQSCRLLPVAGTMVATADERKLYSRARQAFGAQDSRDGGLSDDEREILDRVASREWTRSFGEVVFDRVIDLTGDPLPSGIARAPFRGASTEATA